MARRPTHTPSLDDSEESRRFIDIAREVEADESLEAMERAFKRVVKKKIPDITRQPPKKPSL